MYSPPNPQIEARRRDRLLLVWPEAEIDELPQRAFILGDGSFDGDKGLAVGARPWDHQLRQAILLAAPYEVVADAPIEGFLHRTNTLDTLGDDVPESPCHLNR
jgi:hypothetical protein